MKHISFFAGIGGFDLAARWVGWENVAHIEKEPYARKVLKKNFPESKPYEDIKEFNGYPYRGAIDIVSGGFPCQPFSTAGKREGTSDDRHLWPEMLRVIREIQPPYVVGENVAGILSMDDGRVIDRILADLEGEGYEVQTFLIPACGVEAIHRRDRVWIVAHSPKNRRKRRMQIRFSEDSPKNPAGMDNRVKGSRDNGAPPNNPKKRTNKHKPTKEKRQVPKPRKEASFRGLLRPTVSPICRTNDGVSARLDPNRRKRLMALGNAIVPQVAYEIFKAIDAHNQNSDLLK